MGRVRDQERPWLKPRGMERDPAAYTARPENRQTEKRNSAVDIAARADEPQQQAVAPVFL